MTQEVECLPSKHETLNSNSSTDKKNVVSMKHTCEKKNDGITNVVVHAGNPSTWEAETGGLRIQSQPMLHSKTLSQKKKR
jgi:hypothetical protein